MNTICASAFWDKVFKNGPQNIGGEAKSILQSILVLSTRCSILYFQVFGVSMEISGQSSIAIIRLQGNIELNTVLSTGFT